MDSTKTMSQQSLPFCSPCHPWSPNLPGEAEPEPGSLSPVSSSQLRCLGAWDLPMCRLTGNLFLAEFGASQLPCHLLLSKINLILSAWFSQPVYTMAGGGLSCKTSLHVNQAPRHLLDMHAWIWRRQRWQKLSAAKSTSEGATGAGRPVRTAHLNCVHEGLSLAFLEWLIFYRSFTWRKVPFCPIWYHSIIPTWVKEPFSRGTPLFVKLCPPEVNSIYHPAKAMVKKRLRSMAQCSLGQTPIYFKTNKHIKLHITGFIHIRIVQCVL